MELETQLHAKRFLKEDATRQIVSTGTRATANMVTIARCSNAHIDIPSIQRAQPGNHRDHKAHVLAAVDPRNPRNATPDNDHRKTEGEADPVRDHPIQAPRENQADPRHGENDIRKETTGEADLHPIPQEENSLPMDRLEDEMGTMSYPNLYLL